MANPRFEIYTGESESSKTFMDDVLEGLYIGFFARREQPQDAGSGVPWVAKGGCPKKQWNLDFLTRDNGASILRDSREIQIRASGLHRLLWTRLYLTPFSKQLDLLKFPWAKNLMDINYSLVQGMRTRKGTVAFRVHIIEEAADMTREQVQERRRGPGQDKQETGIVEDKQLHLPIKSFRCYR